MDRKSEPRAAGGAHAARVTPDEVLLEAGRFSTGATASHVKAAAIAWAGLLADALFPAAGGTRRRNPFGGGCNRS